MSTSDAIRAKFAPLLKGGDVVRLCLEFGLSERDARTLIYGDRARGLDPRLPRVPIGELLGDPRAHARWARDVVIDRLLPLLQDGSCTAGGHVG